MAKHLVFGKYSSSAAAGVAKEGFEARSQFTAQVFEALGVKQLNYWVVGDGEWDFTVLLEGDLTRPQLAAVNLTTSAAGSIDRSKAIALLEPAEADQAFKAMPAYRPPGQ
jgi:uncharacterized protein with GYD domain